MRDIFIMRQVAQSLDVRNAAVEPDPEWNSFISESVDILAGPVIVRNVNQCQCGNLLTIEDVFSRCRECMISI